MKTMVVIVLCLLVHASATIAIDMASSRGLGQGRTISFRESSATELLAAPTGSFVSGQWMVEAGFDRKYELSDFDQFFLAGAYRRGFVTVALGLSQMGGTDLYREQTIRMMTSGQYRAFSAGFVLSGKQVDITGGYDQLRAHAFGFAASFRSRHVYIGTTFDNLNKPTLYKGAVPDNPVYAAYAEVVGHRSFSFTGRVTVEETEETQIALGQRIGLGDYTTFFWGLGTKPVEYGAGVELRWGEHAFTYAASYHPTLGLSFTVTLSTGGGRPPKQKADEFE